MTPHIFHPARAFSWQNVDSLRAYAVIQGVIGGLAGAIHGLYELQRGNTPTGGHLLSAVGAFTLIPNYLFTGAAAICAGLALIVWTVAFLHRRRGPAVFLLLAVLLFLVGGGVAQVPFFLIAFGVAAQINRPLTWWQRTLPTGLRQRLARLWPALFAAGYAFFLAGFGIWLFLLPPGTLYTGRPIEYICWSALAIGFALQMCAILAGFAREVQRRAQTL